MRNPNIFLALYVTGSWIWRQRMPMAQCLKSCVCSDYEPLVKDAVQLPVVDEGRVTAAVNVVKLFLPDCLSVDDVLKSRDELKKLAQARNISKILAKSATAIHIARGIKCPKGTENVLRQTLVDNCTVFKSMYSVLAYLYLSPGADTDGMIDQVVAQTADRTIMLGDMTVLSHAMRVDGVDIPHSSQDLAKMGLSAADSDTLDPIQLVGVMEPPSPPPHTADAREDAPHVSPPERRPQSSATLTSLDAKSRRGLAGQVPAS
ncbi:putative [Psittacid alphaherpesvirus 1]|uniref:Tegument protein UL51 n=1 Tax=Psittacid herpesvirus 1 (isolate Amazon parrot/-/97-0001/1997) TaxID=670426 RepID=TEG7_PSHV1|nr:tegument protein UL51 [Psittacid alphaherpesvirus 1]Q6UDM1.1 RecName: Full=Tegument protein UL51 [Psittacid herpesvirus 1 Amazon parrot/1997]AAQ73689.1 putative [Psittacid alphaherpesvirus 1]